MKRNLKDYKIEVIPTGLPQMNSLMGIGGYPKTFLTMISGAGGVGKTTLAAQGIVEAQKKGENVLYVETDFKFVPSYMQSLGVVFDNLTVIQGEVGEDLLNEMLEEIQPHNKNGEPIPPKKKYGLVVIDTVSKITPREEVQKDFNSETIGKQAKLIGRWLRKLKPLALQHNMAVVLLNHERIDFMNQGKIKTPGGEAIQEDVIMWIRLSFGGKYKEIAGKKIYKIIKAKMWRKNQVAATEGMEVLIDLEMGRGFSPTADLMQAAIEEGIITKNGGHYFLGEEKIAYGQTKAREWAKENEEKLKELIS